MKVNDKVYYFRDSDLRSCDVVRVGRKYIYILDGFQEVKCTLEADGSLKKVSAYGRYLFFTEQAVYDQQQRNRG
jgi:hypothetical protein